MYCARPERSRGSSVRRTRWPIEVLCTESVAVIALPLVCRARSCVGIPLLALVADGIAVPRSSLDDWGQGNPKHAQKAADECASSTNQRIYLPLVMFWGSTVKGRMYRHLRVAGEMKRQHLMRVIEVDAQ